jgi:coenzyme F420-0:L-glutamate ligase/coenzyme F420-1:gamma-L-glutamate ligase
MGTRRAIIIGDCWAAGSHSLENNQEWFAQDDERLACGNHVCVTYIMPDAFSLALFPVPGIPLAGGGEDVGEIIVEKCRAANFAICDRDVVVIAQKLVSKAEHRVYKLADFDPSPQARALSERTGRDPRMCEAYLQESDEVVEIGRATRHGLMVMTRHKIGFVAQGAGIDQSNICAGDEPHLIMLPKDPDASAREIRGRIRALTGREVAVIINDSFGRLDRLGSMGMSIGFAGISHVERRKQTDLFGGHITPVIALVDELSAAASMLMGQGDEGIPVVIVRGAPYTTNEESGIRDLLYHPE